jgi:hypothetical protein
MPNGQDLADTQYMVDKLGIEVDNHDLFNTLIFYTELPNDCAKVFTQPIDTMSMVTNRAGVGRPGPPLRGAGRGAISIKEILEENRGTCI